MGARRRSILLGVALLGCVGRALALVLRPRRAPACPFVIAAWTDESPRAWIDALTFERGGGRVLAIHSKRGLVRLAPADLREGRAVPETVRAAGDFLPEWSSASALSDDGARLVLTGQGGDLVPVDLLDLARRTTIAHVASACREIAISRDGKVAVTHDLFPGLALRAWDLETGTSRTGPQISTGSFDVSPPALTIDVSSVSSQVLFCRHGMTGVWDLGTGETQLCKRPLRFARLAGDTGLVVGFELGRDGPPRTIELVLWNPRTGESRVLWKDYGPYWLTRAWASPDGSLVAANLEHELAVWSLRAPGPPRRFAFPRDRAVVIGESVPALAFAPDGRSLVLAFGAGPLAWLDLEGD